MKMPNQNQNPQRKNVLIAINPEINDWINKQAFGFQISKFVRKIWMEYIDKEKK